MEASARPAHRQNSSCGAVVCGKPKAAAAGHRCGYRSVCRNNGARPSDYRLHYFSLRAAPGLVCKLRPQSALREAAQ